MTSNDAKILVAVMIGFVLGGITFTRGFGILEINEQIQHLKENTNKPVQGVVSQFQITLKDARTVTVKVEYAVSFADNIVPADQIAMHVIEIAKRTAVVYDDIDVYTKNLIFHLNDKMPIMTGTRFRVVNIRAFEAI